MRLWTNNFSLWDLGTKHVCMKTVASLIFQPENAFANEVVK